MKKSLLPLLMLLSMTLSAQNLFVGTYNIRNNGSNGDEQRGNGWSQRLSVVCGQILFEQPDIFGTQEVLHNQVMDLKRELTGYDYIGVGRDDGKEAGEYECIWYKTDRLTLLDKGNFWLSENPDRPGKGWDAVCIRICSWGKFTVTNDSSARPFFYFNLHMDHIGVVARRESAKLIIRKIQEIAQGAPVVVTGDFNVDQNDEIYSIFTESGILKDSFVAAKQKFAENGTFNSFDPELKTDSRIDHIFVSPTTTVNHYAIMTNGYWTGVKKSKKQKGNDAPGEITFEKYRMRTASDHYPVWAKITL